MSIQFKVKTLQGELYDFDVPETTTLGDFRRMVEERSGVVVAQQRLILLGHVIQDDDRTLRSYDVANKTMHLVERPPPSDARQSAAEYRRNDAPPQQPFMPDLSTDEIGGHLRRILDSLGETGRLTTVTMHDHGQALDISLEYNQHRTTIVDSPARQRLYHVEELMRHVNHIMYHVDMTAIPSLTGDDDVPTTSTGDVTTTDIDQDFPRLVAGCAVEAHYALPDGTTVDLFADERDADEFVEDLPPLPTGHPMASAPAVNANHRVRVRQCRVPSYIRALRALTQMQTRYNAVLARSTHLLEPQTTYDAQSRARGQNMVRLFQAVQTMMHTMSHLTHTMSDMNVHFADATPRTLYPQMCGQPTTLDAQAQVQIRLRREGEVGTMQNQQQQPVPLPPQQHILRQQGSGVVRFALDSNGQMRVIGGDASALPPEARAQLAEHMQRHAAAVRNGLTAQPTTTTSVTVTQTTNTTSTANPVASAIGGVGSMISWALGAATSAFTQAAPPPPPSRPPQPTVRPARGPFTAMYRGPTPRPPMPAAATQPPTVRQHIGQEIHGAQQVLMRLENGDHIQFMAQPLPADAVAMNAQMANALFVGAQPPMDTPLYTLDPFLTCSSRHFHPARMQRNLQQRRAEAAETNGETSTASAPPAPTPEPRPEVREENDFLQHLRGVLTNVVDAIDNRMTMTEPAHVRLQRVRRGDREDAAAQLYTFTPGSIVPGRRVITRTTRSPTPRPTMTPRQPTTAPPADDAHILHRVVGAMQDGSQMDRPLSEFIQQLVPNIDVEGELREMRDASSPGILQLMSMLVNGGNVTMGDIFAVQRGEYNALNARRPRLRQYIAETLMNDNARASDEDITSATARSVTSAAGWRTFVRRTLYLPEVLTIETHERVDIALTLEAVERANFAAIVRVILREQGDDFGAQLHTLLMNYCRDLVFLVDYLTSRAHRLHPSNAAFNSADGVLVGLFSASSTSSDRQIMGAGLEAILPYTVTILRQTIQRQPIVTMRELAEHFVVASVPPAVDQHAEETMARQAEEVVKMEEGDERKEVMTPSSSSLSDWRSIVPSAWLSFIDADVAAISTIGRDRSEAYSSGGRATI